MMQCFPISNGCSEIVVCTLLCKCERISVGLFPGSEIAKSNCMNILKFGTAKPSRKDIPKLYSHQLSVRMTGIFSTL